MFLRIIKLVLTSHSIVGESFTELIANDKEDRIRKFLTCDKLLKRNSYN